MARSGRRLIALALLLAAKPASARDALGLWGDWGAFRDGARCYAIAMPIEGGGAYMTLSVDRASGAVHPHWHLGGDPAAPRSLAVHVMPGPAPTHVILLMVRSHDAWTSDPVAEAPLVAALPRQSSLIVSHPGARARLTWRLAGLASALDAARLGCAR